MIKDILKKIGGSWLFLMAVTLLYLATAFFDTQAAWRGLAIFSKLFVKILPTLVFVFGLLFISNLLIDTQTVVRHLGKGAKKGAWLIAVVGGIISRSEEHTSELQSHSFISYAVFCLKKKKDNNTNNDISHTYVSSHRHTITYYVPSPFTSYTLS